MAEYKIFSKGDIGIKCVNADNHIEALKKIINNDCSYTEVNTKNESNYVVQGKIATKFYYVDSKTSSKKAIITQTKGNKTTMVKVFRFRVSNASSHASSDDKEKSWYINGKKELISEKQIETTINTFIKGKSNVSIIVTPIPVSYHNNARGNTIDLIYTITYDM